MDLSLTRRSFLPVSLIACLYVTSLALAQIDLDSLARARKLAVVSITSYDKKGNVLTSGTGFFINRVGEVLTRRRVIPAGTVRAEVKTHDGKVYPVVGMVNDDGELDLASILVDIPSERVRHLIYRGILPEVGEQVFVISSKAGAGQEVITGTVSAIEESSLGKAIRVDASIGQGSNGSPVFNAKGELVGVAVFLGEGQKSFTASAGESLSKGMPTYSEEIVAIKKPKLLNRPAPVYSAAARQKGVEGSVYLRALVGENGKVKQARVVRGLPEGLTEEAVRAAFKLKFKPAMKEGKPVEYWVPVMIEFRLGR